MAKTPKKKTPKKAAKRKTVKTAVKKKTAKAKAKPAVKAKAKTVSAKAKSKKKKAKRPLTPKERLSLIKNWKKRRLRTQMKAEKKLSNYIERLVEKYPKDYMEKIKEGLVDEEKFNEIADDLKFDMESSASETDEEFLERFSRSLRASED